MAKHLSPSQTSRSSGLRKTLCVGTIIALGAALATTPLQAEEHTSSAARAELQQNNTRTIKGVVVDENGESLPGASILVEGTQTGVVTDLDGNFRITLPAGKNKLRVSFVGYTPVSIVAKDGMKVQLLPDTKTIKEVVVTGMVATDKRLFTGATDKLTADKIKLDGVADVSRGLEGRSAGVSVQNVSGTFGTAPKIRVRGATSIHGSSKPLWVVDGVIQEDVVEVSADALSSGDATTLISSAISGLNADDIESFQILKDGSATSIYGAKAMAGVIVITTKKGRSGTSSFNYTGEFTTRLIPSYNEFNIMNSQQQMDLYRELQNKGWMPFGNTVRAANYGVFGKMYELMNTYNEKTGQFMLENSRAAENAYLREAEMRNTDWFRELFSSSLMQNHSISMTTGTDKSQTYVSVSAMIDPGWTKASSVSRYTGNFNNTYNFTPKVSLTTIGGLSYRQQQAPGTLSQNSDPITGTVSRDFDINPYSYAINSSRTLDPKAFYRRNFAPFNIHNELDNNYLELDVFDLKLQTELKWRPIRGLTLSALGSIKYSNTTKEHKITEFSNLAQAYRAMDNAVMIGSNSWLYKDPDKINTQPTTILPEGGFYNTNTYRMNSYDFRASATYTTEIADKHIINAYAGIEFNAQNRMQNGFDGWGMQYDRGEIPFWVYPAFKQLSEQGSAYYYLSNTRVRTHAVFGTATYSYKGRYTLTGTMRYEGSNRLGRSRRSRWLPTWNIAAAWNAHEEPWFRKQNIFDTFTLKASYSLTADAGPATNSLVIIRSHTPWRNETAAQETGATISGYENQELTYEKKNELNLGVDMGFFDNRLNITADVYKRNNFDLMGSIMTTQGDRFGNSAEMKSHGFELSISTKNIQTKKFSWTTDFIFGYAKNEITKLRSRNYLWDYVSGVGFAREGYPVRALFSIPFEGLTAEGFPTYKFQDKVLGPDSYGSVNYRLLDDFDFLKYEGPTDPVYTGSFGNIFTLGNFKLNVFITYSGGNKLRLASAYQSRFSDLEANQRNLANRWAVVGDEVKTSIPTLPAAIDAYTIGSLGAGYNVYNYTDQHVADGSFVRMKEISLQYTVPNGFLQKLKVVKSASLKLQATNLFLIYADKKLNGQDPEFFRAGGVSAPVAKQITATLRVGF
ncbi:MAG: SusC/RagA family TonB-linked outer membrane protein [Porphyromonas sp.]|nr:SusC/RagA family TonB-linked outer membrane protein [Porphyromonas sp.]